uniref:HECT domain-containing protein n=1 Tax=Macrostomum lignano TaxID=282301 RepID=A0A1I8JQ56_9PLAT
GAAAASQPRLSGSPPRDNRHGSSAKAARPYDLCAAGCWLHRLIRCSCLRAAASTMRHALAEGSGETCLPMPWRQLRVSAAAPAGERRHELPVFSAAGGVRADTNGEAVCDTPSRMVGRDGAAAADSSQTRIEPPSCWAAPAFRPMLNEYQLGRCGLAWRSSVKRRRHLASLYSAALQQGLPAAARPELTGFANVFANLCQHSGGCCSSFWTGCRLHWLAKLPSSPSEPWKLPPPPRRLAELLTPAPGVRSGGQPAGRLGASVRCPATLPVDRSIVTGSAADLASAASSTEASAASTVGPIAQTLDDDESVHELEETDQFSSLGRPLPPSGRASEDAHWLLLVVGHVIVEPDAEEAAPFVHAASCPSRWPSRPMWPRVSELCGEACQGQGRAGGGHSQQVDRLLQLVAAVMRMACLLARTAPTPSPLVLTDIAWLLSRLSRVYFGLDETLYDTISPAILAAFGTAANLCAACAQFAVDYCRVCLARWPGEPELANEAAKLMCALTERRDCIPNPLRIKYCGSSGTRVRRTSKLNFLSSLPAQLVAAGPGYRRANAALTQAPPQRCPPRCPGRCPSRPSSVHPRPTSRPRTGRHSTLWNASEPTGGVTVGRLQLRAGELISSGLPDSSTEAALALALDALAGSLGCQRPPDAAGTAGAPHCCLRHRAAAAPASVQASPSRGQSAVSNCRTAHAPRPTRVELGQLVGLLHSMLSQSLLDFWSEPEEHLLDGGETASTGAETEAAAVSGFADLLPRGGPSTPAELAEPTLRLCVAAAEAASDRLLAMPEEALNSLAMGCLRPALAGELPSDSRRLACECVSALGLSGWPLSGRHARSAAGRPALPQVELGAIDPAAAAASPGTVWTRAARWCRTPLLAPLVWRDPARFDRCWPIAWLISARGTPQTSVGVKRLGDALNQLLRTRRREAAAASSRTAPSGSVLVAGRSVASISADRPA